MIKTISFYWSSLKQQMPATPCNNWSNLFQIKIICITIFQTEGKLEIIPTSIYQGDYMHFYWPKMCFLVNLSYLISFINKKIGNSQISSHTLQNVIYKEVVNNLVTKWELHLSKTSVMKFTLSVTFPNFQDILQLQLLLCSHCLADNPPGYDQ